MTDKHTLWQSLQQTAQSMPSLTKLFADEPKRGERYGAEACGIYMDYSKQLIDQAVLTHLLALATEKQLKDKIDALLSGQKVNHTEHRAALHTALRLPKTAKLSLDGVDIVEQVHCSLDKLTILASRIRTGVWRGYLGQAITDVVNIGVGGSDLGPLMATTALAEWADTSIRVHFVSNMDGTQLDGLLKVLSPQTTLFIISSKSFATADTLSNAKTALAWLSDTGANQKSILRRHFIGISTRVDKMTAWGIDKDNQLTLWDWVGGRFSMWSTIGLAIAIKIGTDNFKALLAGAYAMDCHFRNTDFAHNLPVLLGLIAVWNSTFLGINAHAVLPYDGRLSYFPNYLTQLEMESNGKSVRQDGTQVDFATCPILWGDIGSNAQHAFYQLLHQGTQRVSCDFIATIRRYDSTADGFGVQHRLSLANCLAQSQVLAFGNQVAQDDPRGQFLHYRGNQPSTTLLLDELSPHRLGALIALYEHKVYVMSVLWDINPFDQWGVELGKVMAGQVYGAMMGDNQAVLDDSTTALMAKIKQKQIERC